jgi:hypothetical protein
MSHRVKIGRSCAECVRATTRIELKTCNQMQDIPWIMPDMEVDHVCIHCWMGLTVEERIEYEKLFLQ